MSSKPTSSQPSVTSEATHLLIVGRRSCREIKSIVADACWSRPQSAVASVCDYQWNCV
jgi:hypothetical protein